MRCFFSHRQKYETANRQAKWRFQLDIRTSASDFLATFSQAYSRARQLRASLKEIEDAPARDLLERGGEESARGPQVLFIHHDRQVAESVCQMAVSRTSLRFLVRSADRYGCDLGGFDLDGYCDLLADADAALHFDALYQECHEEIAARSQELIARVEGDRPRP